MTGDTVRAAGYIRVSSDEQATEGYSLGSQADRIRALIEAEGWELDQIYREEGVKGDEWNRPELSRLLAKLGEIDRVVIVKVDRLSRDEALSFALYKQFEENGVELRSIEDNIDGTENGLLLRGFLTTLAAHESRRSSARIKQAQIKRASEGKHHARWPWGYDAKGQPVEPAASVVTRIWRASAEGQSQRGIAASLNAEGIKTAQGKEWRQTQIKKILDNATYTGRIRDSEGSVIAGKHPAIITVELFDSVQALRQANRRDKGGQARGRKPNGSHLFTKGLLRCAHCGEAMVPRTDGAGSYRCHTTWSVKADACVQTAVPRAALDTAVFEFFMSEHFDAEQTKAQIEAKVAATHRQRAELLTEAARAEAKAQENFDRAWRQARDGDITPKEWREDWKPELESELTAATAHHDQLEQQMKASAAEVKSIAALANSSALQGLARIKREVAGKVTAGDGIDSLRANLSLLFERFEIARAPATIAAELAADEDTYPAFAVGEWIVWMVPRTEWVGDLDGYWREILGRVPLAINETLGTATD